MKAIVVAGTHSSCGKTTLTLGLLAALREKGLTVQPFKTGPDFIDAGLHSMVTGRPSRNLDQWMCGTDYVSDCFRRHAADADIAVIEGVMGMYDGEFSTAGLASLLGVPVLLVVDGYGMAESAGAIVEGYAKFGNHPPMSPLAKGGHWGVAGVVFNRVASDSHFERLKAGVRDVPVLGYLPRELDFEIPHRHLGLATAVEEPLSGENIRRLAHAVLKHIDMEGLLKYAECSADIPLHGEEKGGDGIPGASAIVTHPHPATLPEGEGRQRVRIAVARDRAFSFYYQDNLDLLQQAGAEIVPFSPLEDNALPDGIDAVYIGGGYPELHAAGLSENSGMRSSIHEWSNGGGLLYAECGGLMYLSKGIRDFDGRLFGMAGVFPFETAMMRKPRLGYREIELSYDCLLGKTGEKCRGHEFHYSEALRIADCGPRIDSIYTIQDARGRDRGIEGYRYKNTLASYIHVHFGSNPELAKAFVRFGKQESEETV